MAHSIISCVVEQNTTLPGPRVVYTLRQTAIFRDRPVLIQVQTGVGVQSTQVNTADLDMHHIDVKIIDGGRPGTRSRIKVVSVPAIICLC